MIAMVTHGQAKPPILHREDMRTSRAHTALKHVRVEPEANNMPGFCRDCRVTCRRGARCGACGSPAVPNREIDTLCVAHVDCDAFYAASRARRLLAPDNR